MPRDIVHLLRPATLVAAIGVGAALWWELVEAGLVDG
jgi:hypothetical protein